MNKLDVFLENNWNRQETALTYGENSLRIGFSNPLMAGGLADAFETYGKQHPDVSIHIFSGEESELCRELETHKLDIIFLPENTDISKKTHYNARMVLLRYAPVVMEYADLPIEPITQNQITQIALWRDSKKITCRRFFHWMPEQICRGSVADVGFDVVCYNIEKGNRFYLSDR